MSYAETPVPSQADRIEQELAEVKANQQKLIDAFNGVGGNVQWIVDNVKGIFEMFNNPQMLGMMQGMMGGGIPGMEKQK
jgi:phage-related protein